MLIAWEMSVASLNQVRNQQREGNDTPVDRMDMEEDIGLDRDPCDGCNVCRASP